MLWCYIGRDNQKVSRFIKNYGRIFLGDYYPIGILEMDGNSSSFKTYFVLRSVHSATNSRINGTDNI